MKRILLSLLLSGLAMFAVWSCNAAHPNAGSTAVPDTTALAAVYTCPMHPSVISDRPGACPVCGMALVLRSGQAAPPPQDLNALQEVSLSSVQRVTANISTVKAQRIPFTRQIRLPGIVQIAQPREATVSARFRGRVEQVHVNSTGAVVEKGTPLFELYSPDLISAQQEYLIALQRDADGVLAQAAKQRLLTQLGMTGSQLSELVRTRTVRTSVTFTAPIAGTVLAKNVLEGQYVSEGTSLYELADLSSVWILFDVSEQDIRTVRPGQEVTVSSRNTQEFDLTGRITFVDAVVDPETRTVKVRSDFTNPAGALRPGMFVDGIIDCDVRTALTVPVTALLETGNRSVVWVETKENRFEMRSVEVGVRNERNVEILSGLRQGESVAATGGFLIDSESQLQAPAGGTVKPTARNHAETAMKTAQAQVVTIVVDGTYSPDVIHVRKGIPVRLRFDRRDSGTCTDEVVFKSLGIRRRLTTGATTTIEFIPVNDGEIVFTCGMEMVEGKVVVE